MIFISIYLISIIILLWLSFALFIFCQLFVVFIKMKIYWKSCSTWMELFSFSSRKQSIKNKQARDWLSCFSDYWCVTWRREVQDVAWSAVKISTKKKSVSSDVSNVWQLVSKFTSNKKKKTKRTCSLPLFIRKIHHIVSKRDKTLSMLIKIFLLQMLNCYYCFIWLRIC